MKARTYLPLTPFAFAKVLIFFAWISAVHAGDQVLVFEGENRVKIARSEGCLDLNQDFTVEAWLRLDPFERDEYILGNEMWGDSPGNERGWIIRRRMDGNNPLIEFNFATAETHWTAVAAPFNQTDKPFHVAVCRKGKSLSLWIGGKLAGKLDVSKLTPINSNDCIYLGSSPQTPLFRYLNAEIFGLRISTVSRYSKCFTPKLPDGSDGETVVFYDLTKTPIDRLIDLSANHRDGMLEGAKILDLDDLRKQVKAEQEVAAKLPPLNVRLLTFAKKNAGRRVRNGDCWQYVAAAMEWAGARRRDVYVFGEEIPVQSVLPGDIVQFNNFKSPGFGSEIHTAIVWKITGKTSVLVSHSNGPPLGAFTGTYEIDFSKFSGDVHFYRPTP